MTDEEVDAIRERSCTRKAALGARSARALAEKMQRLGHDVRPYRCVFDGDHWHVGHPLSWEGVERLAAAIRHRQYPTADQAEAS